MEPWTLLLHWSAPTARDGRWHWRRPLHHVIRGTQVVWDALFAFVTEEALIRASSLAFTSVLALVPLLTVGLRVMNFYGVSVATRDEFEAVLAQYLLPAQSRDVVNLVLQAASQVTQNIGALGLAGFCVTLVLMARELEGHIQKICGARGSLATSLVHYAAFLVLAPTGALLAFALLHPLAALLALLPGGFERINYPFVLSIVVLFVTLRAFSGFGGPFGEAEEVRGSFTSYKPGVDGGAGFAFNLGYTNRVKMFVEARYHRMFTSGFATSFVPVTVGVSF